MPETAEPLPARLPTAAFLPFLIAGVIIAAAYGSSFLLPEYLRTMAFDNTSIGRVISAGMVTTLLCCCLAGWAAQHIGVMGSITAAAVAMAGAMVAFACVPLAPEAAYAGGLLLGVGWSVFYILAPLQIIHHLQPSARLQYFTILSGAQMAGLGLATPLGHLIVQASASYGLFYELAGSACLVSALCLVIAQRAMAQLPKSATRQVSLRLTDLKALLGSQAALPIAMILLGACIFSGLSTYQASYAEGRQLRADNFFITFTLTSVLLRFSVARSIGRLPLQRLAVGLFLFTSLSLGMFLLNRGSTSLYLLATVVFAVGYGLSYSTLNSLAVNQAEANGLSPSVTSQVFTLAYFIGLFGFPSLGGAIMGHWGIDWVLVCLLAAALINLLLIASTHYRRLPSI
ncbi:MFS transporter [Pseudomonas vanderleydeniana]|uniref:MFS transporter n=1 Tax=Pseudomonas vanderleydeniana TaxID=2745495 RepID=A0A9E6PQT4_9PSED|nr:MFS transporter [Pseudomonas vanderleydeniana]QXI30535.1 MFS transporter [Pseudomonas vanderleydeniana]